MAVLTAPTPTRKAKRAPACRTCAEYQLETGCCRLTAVSVEGAEGATFCPLALPGGHAGKPYRDRVAQMVQAAGMEWRLRLYETGELRAGGSA